MKIIKQKYRTLGSLYSLRPKCSSCSQTLQKDKSYDCICDNCIDLPSSNPFFTSSESYQTPNYICEKCPRQNCRICHNPCQDSISDSVNAILGFIEVNCYYHSEVLADYFDPNTFLTYCIDCYNKGNLMSYRNMSDLRSYNLYLENVEVFRRLFVKHKKKLCPERRASLIPYTTQELLDGIRFLIKIEEIKCDEHWAQGLIFDDELRVYCRDCQVQSMPTYSIDNEKSPFRIKDLIKDLTKVSSFENLNKFILKVSNSRQNYSSNEFSVNILLLEGQKFKYHPDISCRRCVSCLEKMTEGKKKPIILQCNHIMCFECIHLKSAEWCPIDNGPVEQKNFLNFNGTKHLPSFINKLITTKGILYKASCTHICDEDDVLSSKTCPECLFPNDYFSINYGQNSRTVGENALKVHKKAMSLRDFFSVRCFFHDKMMGFLDFNRMSLHCETCLKGMSDSSRKNVLEIGEYCEDFYFLALGEYFGEILKTLKIDYKQNSVLTKKASYFNVLPYQERNEISNKILLGDGKMLPFDYMENFHVLERFKLLLPQTLSSKKLYSATEKDIQGFNLETNKDIYLIGFHISLKYIILCDKLPLYKQIKFVKIIKKQPPQDLDNKQDIIISEETYEVFQSADHNEELVFFPKALFLQRNYNYDIILKLHPGFYDTGLPFSRVPLDIFTLNRLKSVPAPYKELGNSNLGGPILGFILREFAE